jgi:uncharacterized protein
MTGPALIEKLKPAYQRWHDTRGASVDDWIAIMHEGIEMRSLADGAEGMEFTKERKGREATRGYFSKLAEDWEMISYRADEFLVDGDRVVVFGHCAFKHRKTGKVADSRVVHRWRFVDGLAAEFFEFYDTAKAFAAATPDPK